MFMREIHRVIPRMAIIVASLAYFHGPTSAQEKDSLAVYRKLQAFADKHRFTRWLHDAVLVRVPEHEVERAGAELPKRDPHRNYRGRTIRHVEVYVLDPFGSNVNDTAIFEMSGLERAGNSVHRRTRERIVRNQLLFAEGDKLDPLRLSESERILRRTGVVNDARITVLPIRGSKAVDVRVIVQDRWSIEGGIQGDATSAEFRATEHNLLGLGQELDQRMNYQLGPMSPAWSGTHRVYNIGQSFVGSTASYRLSQQLDQASAALDRPFYSPFARWAGRLSCVSTWYRPAEDPNLSLPLQGTVRSTSFDTWAGLNLMPRKDSADVDRSSAYILAGRHMWSDHVAPAIIIDSLGYKDTRAGLVSFSVGVRRYTTSHYLYRFGAAEDVAEGVLISATTGARWQRASLAEPYAGLSITRASYTKGGRYLALGAAIGSFWHQGTMTDARVVLTANWFTELVPLGRWRLRHFGRAAFAKNVMPAIPDQLDLGGTPLLRMDPVGWHGDQKISMRMEFVGYSPYRILGFRFAPVLLVAAGALASEHELIYNSTVKPALGVGLLIRNERLLDSSIQVSIGFYPGLPSDEGDMFRYNAIETLGVRSPDLAPSAPAFIGLP